MAIKRQNNHDADIDSLEELDLKIDNGDLKALKEIIKKFEFKSPEAVLRYALAIFSITDKASIEVTKKGDKVTVNPSQDLLNKNDKRASDEQ